MSLLKQLSDKLNSIKNIQKITKTMKMVSASKFARADRELKWARPFGYGPRKFYETSQLTKKEEEDEPSEKQKTPQTEISMTVQKPEDTEKKKNMKRIYVAVTSDRGLCGGVHTDVTRHIVKAFTAREADENNHKFVCIGEKSRMNLRSSHPKNILLSANEVGRLAPVFADASRLAAGITEAGFAYDMGEIYYNKFFSPVKRELTTIPIFTRETIEKAPNISAFDEVDGDMLESYVEWTLAALLYYVLKESAASEQSARMSAMTNATKNADEMLRKLSLQYNRTRQAVITRELIEIISGAAAL